MNDEDDKFLFEEVLHSFTLTTNSTWLTMSNWTFQIYPHNTSEEEQILENIRKLILYVNEGRQHWDKLNMSSSVAAFVVVVARTSIFSSYLAWQLDHDESSTDSVFNLVVD